MFVGKWCGLLCRCVVVSYVMLFGISVVLVLVADWIAILLLVGVGWKLVFCDCFTVLCCFAM